MNSDAARADDLARREAIGAAGSVLLEAPAGSGKTAVLSARYLRLLATVEDPGEILAVTFTRKAAAEMRARVLRALRGEFAAHDPNAQALRALAQAALTHGAARGWQLAQEPQTLRIQTIDSFNYWLASQLPVAARIGGTLNVTESAAELYQRAARATLTAADSDPELQGDAQLLFERLDNHWLNLERLLAQMLRERGHWLRFVSGEDPHTLCARINESLAALTGAQLTALVALVPEGLRRRAAALTGSGPLGAEAVHLAHWKQLAHLTLTQKDDWRTQVGARLGAGFADPGVSRQLKDLIADLRLLPAVHPGLVDIRRAPAPQLTHEEAAAIHALSRLLQRAVQELYAEFALAQRVDYTYVTGAARAALTESGEPTELALRTGLRLRHILVDEFQDTSLAQFQLLEMLTVGWEEGDGRTLFAVGDPMQSIYRFRDAEVGLFLKARRAGIGTVVLRNLRLARNFRADPPLVAFANEVFAAVFPATDDLRSGAVAYRVGTAARAPLAPLAGVPPVSLALFPDDRNAEAHALATRVAQLRRLDPDGSIAVLVVAHAHAVPVVEALQRQGIGALGVDLVPLRECSSVRDLVQLMRALCDLADRTAWLAVLHAPWCGARLTSLAALSAPDDRQLIIEALADPERLGRCLPEDRPRLARLYATLSAALTQRSGCSAVEWLENTWMRLGAPDAYDLGELTNARAFFAALAERCAALEWRGPADFDALLADLYSVPPAGAAHSVQVMTIHRAKGLEFDHVLVPALERATRGAERRLMRWIDLPGEGATSELLIAPTPAVGTERPSELDTYLRDLVHARDANEQRRLVYVAATRARRTLWLSAAPRTAVDGTLSPDRRSPLAVLWPALGGRFVSAAPAAAAAVAVAPGVPLRRLGKDWHPPQVPAAVPLTQLPAAQLPSEPPEFSWVGETQRHIGTVVHAWLARIALEGRLPGAEELARERAAISSQLQQAGVPAPELSGATDLIVSAVSRTVADERGRWILGSSRREAHAELALTGVSGGRLRSIIIDRSFIDERGTRWVIDYKTSRHEGADLEGFLAQEMQRYRAQLEGYVALARSLGPEPVRAALYFPLLGAFRELGA
jgi:ATP-dependent exoDNAse (exonuclease V) beta subunit